MKKIYNILAVCFLLVSATSCLHSNLDELENASDKEMTSVEYSYRFLYNDTIKKGTVNEEIQNGRVCEVIFQKQMKKVEENGLKGFQTTLTHSLNSIQKAGPTGSVTKEMLYDMFKKEIGREGLTRLWVYVSISDAATIASLNGAPRLGAPGDFSETRSYRVTAADGSSQDYVLKTMKGF